MESGFALLLFAFVIISGGLFALRKIVVTADRIEATADRIEQATAGGRLLADRQDKVMSQTLDRMEKAAAVVAANLADSVHRADVAEGPDGSAADAALRSGTLPP